MTRKQYAVHTVRDEPVRLRDQLDHIGADGGRVVSVIWQPARQVALEPGLPPYDVASGYGAQSSGGCIARQFEDAQLHHEACRPNDNDRREGRSSYEPSRPSGSRARMVTRLGAPGIACSCSAGRRTKFPLTLEAAAYHIGVVAEDPRFTINVEADPLRGGRYRWTICEGVQIHLRSPQSYATRREAKEDADKAMSKFVRHRQDRE